MPITVSRTWTITSYAGKSAVAEILTGCLTRTSEHCPGRSSGWERATALTSFTHHPYGQRFPLEVPDNRFHDTFLNVPLDTMMHRIVRSLREGHPVCWEGDASEPGFLSGQGFAVLQDESRKVTAMCRQKAFEAHQTTDDHCMEIIGLAHDQHGRRFFLCKNSWGTGNRYRGFMFLSEPYVQMKTVAVVVKNR